MISVMMSRMHWLTCVSIACVILNLKTAALCKKVYSLPCSNITKDDDYNYYNNNTLDSALKMLYDDVVLELDAGEHCISSYTLIRDLQNVTIRGKGDSTTFIKCSDGNGLAFFNVSELTIHSLIISQCGLDTNKFNNFTNVVRKTIEFFFSISDAPDNFIAVACANCANFKLINSEILNTTGLGFLGINLFGNSTIENTNFIANVPNGCFPSEGDSNYTLQMERVGGGAIIVYHDYVERHRHYGDSHLHIDQATFSDNLYCGIQGVYELHLYSQISDDVSIENFMLGGGGGLSVILTQIHYHVNAVIENSLFERNRAGYGGGANVEIFTAVFDSHIVFSGCNFTNNGDQVLNTNMDYVTVGSGIGFISDILQPSFNRSIDIDPTFDLVPCTLTIADSNFTENVAYSGGAIFILSLYAPLLGGRLQEELRIESCLFEENGGVVGGAIYAHEWKQSPFQHGLDIVFHSVTFDNNHVDGASLSAQKSAIIELLNLNVTFSGDTEIANNIGTGLRASSSIIVFKDNITFSNNRGSHGGALSLEAEAFVLLSDNTDIVFHNNVAGIFGGAIYISYTIVSPSLSQVDCSFYFGQLNFECFSTIHSNCSDITKYNTTVTFDSNTASLGSMMYGSTLEHCPWARQLMDTYAPNSNLTVFEVLAKAEEFENFTSPFIFDKPPNNPIEVSTPTERIVVDSAEFTAMPGQTIQVGIQTLDKFNRSVPTVLTSLPSPSAHSNNVSIHIGGGSYHLLQESNDPNNSTVAANVTFFGDEDIPNIDVSLFSLVSLTQMHIAVTLVNCTEGFTYDEGSNACQCSDLFKSSKIECNDDDFTIVVPQDLWVGPGPDGDLVIANCHFDFCLGGRRTIHPPYFDQQCQTNYHRTGITCSQCIEGYSLMFGSNRCNKCESSSLAFIILYAFLGIVLVSAISFLQITVSEGYLNGMLFYANVLNIYLPLLTNFNSEVAYIFILISFLNLNLGIETCFNNGMDALLRTGLHLFFPFYIFVLMLIIVGISNRSSTFSNWSTSNGFSASKVFVTLIIMTYSSLLETCIEILGFDHIGSHYRWRMDNNQAYFRGGHATLGVIAVLLLCLLLVLPFLLFLESRLFKFRVFGRYKPLYDAVWAPFRPKFRFWVGLRLILRGFPFAFIYFVNHPVNILLLAMFLVAVLWIQGMLKPFRGFARNAFDTFFLSNLLVVVLGALYFYIYRAQIEIKDTSTDYYNSSLHPHKKAFYSIVVGTAYIAFLLIIIWHLALRFPRILKYLRTVLQWFKRKPLNRSYRRLNTFTNGKEKTSETQYGAIASDDVGTSEQEENSDEDKNRCDSNQMSVVHERKAVVTFTQWREPLLSSGSLEIETVPVEHNDDKA